MLDAMIGHLGDVDQSFDVAFKAGKRPKLGQAGDDTFHQLTHAELLNT